jgi:WD40 repeat protein
VAAGSNGQEAVKIWDVDSHETVATLEGRGSLFVFAAFSPDGNTIGARNLKGVLYLWRAPSWEEIEAREGRK